MKAKSLFAILIGGSLCWAGSAVADLKVGYVDVQKLLEEAPQAQAIAAQLKKEFQPRQDALQADQDKLKRIEDKLQRDGDVMSDAQRSKYQADAGALRRDLQRHQEDFRDDLNTRKGQALNELQGEIRDAIEAIGSAGKYDLVLYDGIAFTNPRLDMTSQVLDWLTKHDKTPPAAKPQ